MHSFCTEINNVQNKTTNNLIPEKPVHLVCGQRYYCEVEQKTVCVCVFTKKSPQHLIIFFIPLLCTSHLSPPDDTLLNMFWTMRLVELVSTRCSLCTCTTVCCIFCVFTQVSQWYELVVFTASMEIYGSAVADKLDNNRNILKRRYYRQVLHWRTVLLDRSLVSSS